ncbi:MAG TPA: protein-disulfide reductase DsbD N-terminal domain-containing protein [Acidobacteriaceae bacterium]|nr:protein-disulfide reductase DsbD N-terminal domain-containing protein [Acidobacteriaceae bacterium]
MKRIYSLLVTLALVAPLAAPAQLGNLSEPHTPKSYIVYAESSQSVPAKHPAMLELHFRVLPGYHVNSHKPTESFLIPTALTLKPSTGVKAGEPIYPAGSTYSFAFDPKEKLSVYAGDFVVKIPVTASPGGRVMDGELRYQACNNAACFPPRTLTIKVPFTAK